MILLNKPIENVIKARRSVRTYQHLPVEQEIIAKISRYIETLETPFGGKFVFKLIESFGTINGAKLGTYGIIKGAANYIGVTVKEGDFAELSVGYAFEQLILYLTSLGLGTCWMGGTFRRSEFAKAMAIGKDDLFPVISPFGYEAQKRSLSDTLVRYASKGDQRKPWVQLFFDEDFRTPLSKGNAGVWELPLEMVRLAPSASNKQPWRVVRQDSDLHFFLTRTPGYGQALGYDIQMVDMGIAACHFQLTARERGLEGQIRVLTPAVRDIPENTSYIFSWTKG